MNRLFLTLILLVVSSTSFDVAAEGTFCVATNRGQSCSYYDVESCQRAARAEGGICSANQVEQRPPVRFDPAGSYNDAYSAGAEAGRRLRAARAEQASTNVKYLPEPTSFVEKCRAFVAMLDGTAANIYGPEGVSGVSFSAGSCFGYISGYVSALQHEADKAGRTCSLPNDARAIARQVAAISDESIASSTLGLPVLQSLSQGWQCK